MRRLEAHSWLLNLGSGFVIVGCATTSAVVLHRTWSWPLFVWGAVFGVLASAWAFFSTKTFARALLKRAPAEQRPPLEARSRGLWQKYRPTYAGIVLMGIGVGIFSAGLHNPAPDVALTAIWILAGLLPPLVAFPILLRRFGLQSADGDSRGVAP
jgi:hypothetical protein